ncbi:MAG: transketolase [Candidatus Saelkia tenebricola]|nr:transketolase [Candidatus Saelkia tenebricola]
MGNKTDIELFKQKASQIRKDILTMLQEAGSGHTGGSLSLVEILISLYCYKLKHDPKNPDWSKRDRLILSKGHGCPALYAILADCGYFPKNELSTLRKYGSRLQGHPEKGISGVEASTGSLGQGLSIAIGMALSGRLDNRDNKVYCIMGDGETNEGQIWEAAMTAAHYKLDNLIGIIDHNKLQIDGPVKEVKNLEPYKEKWVAFGWKVTECDGHDFNSLIKALDWAYEVKDYPAMIIAHTVKGKGVSFMENDNKWHGVAPVKDELEKAFKELGEK